ncbi:hypothetical protein Cgig2_003210 [Carnegiea gigantea]|uniref:Uncharacterized protein n=1 Tax=Carnegiea gigantea TaxID=171969 RepID=A0A9Q1QBY6_9CARY|nr:hypothetical protein Cgig2_003210 [Carnegiea gigantea]
MAQTKALIFAAAVLAVLAAAVSAQDLGMAPAPSPAEVMPPSMEKGAAFSLPVSAAVIVSSLLVSLVATFNHAWMILIAMDGSCGSQRAPLENGDESTYDPIYRRSNSLKTHAVSPPSDSRVIWVRKEKVQKRTLSYSYNDEKSCINVCRDYANFFDAMVLEKVNTESNGDENFLVTPSFYPTLHRLLTLRRN